MATEEGMSDDRVNLTQVTADILCEFLEVAINQILYVRNVYPSGIFDQRKKYDIPVQMSQHADVNKYISDVLEGIKPLLAEGEIQRVSLVIISPRHHPIESFIFEIARPATRSLRSDSYLLNVEQSLRAFLLRINICDAALQENPAGCTFKVLVHTQSSAVFSNMSDSQFIQNFPWVEADQLLYTLGESKITPLKAMSSELIKMQLYVEEANRKTEGARS